MSARSDRPESSVVDEIDRLVEETMAAGVDATGRPLDDYSVDRYDRCPRCGWEWHGLPNGYCPGPYAASEANESRGVTAQEVIEGWSYNRERARIEIEAMAAQTATPAQIMPPWVVFHDQPADIYSTAPDEIVGGHYVPHFGDPTRTPGELAAFHDEDPAAWNRVFMLPNDGGLHHVPALQGAPFLDALHEQLVHYVVEMIGEVMGIFLPDNDIERVIETVREMTQSARENRERRERVQIDIDHDTMRRLLGYDAENADNSGEAVQGLPGRGDHVTSPLSDTGRWTVSTGTTMRDAPPIDEAAQQDSSARSEGGEGL